MIDMHNLLVPLLFFISHLSLSGQTLISPYASDNVAGNVRVAFSLGELATNQISNTNHLITEGQQQPLILFSDVSYVLSENDLTLYPNPAAHSLFINLKVFEPNRFVYKILSIDGVELVGWQVLSNNQIDIRAFSPDCYQVFLMNTETNQPYFVNFIKI